MNKIDNKFLMVEGEKYDELKVRVLNGSLKEHEGHRRQNVIDFFKILNSTNDFEINLTPDIQYRLSRLAGTTLLKAAYILKSLYSIKDIEGD